MITEKNKDSSSLKHPHWSSKGSDRPMEAQNNYIKRQVLWEDAFKKWTHETGKKDGETEPGAVRITNLYPSPPTGCKHRGNVLAGTRQWPGAPTVTG